MKYNLLNSQVDEYGISALQNKILEITLFIDKICRENNIEYFIMSGTLIGAYRHKGFIPWDDDLDIFMTPKNFKKFKEVFPKESKYVVQEWGIYKDYITTCKVRDSSTTYIEDAYLDCNVNQGVFVDVFMLHNAADNKIARRIQGLWGRYIMCKRLASLGYKNYKGIKKVIAFILGKLPRNFLVKTAYKHIYKYDNKVTKNVAHILGHGKYNVSIYPAKYFASHVDVDFETVKLMAPVNGDEYLRMRWGDYMKMPSKEKIKLSGHCTHWNINESYTNYLDKEVLKSNKTIDKLF